MIAWRIVEGVESFETDSVRVVQAVKAGTPREAFIEAARVVLGEARVANPADPRGVEFHAEAHVGDAVAVRGADEAALRADRFGFDHGKEDGGRI